jgi:hypothetical protein
VQFVLYALLFLPALLAIAYVVHRRPRTLEEPVARAANPFDTLDSVLGELEAATLDERGVAELERLAAELEAAAAELERVA